MAQEQKHTPGPWRWFNYPDGRKLLVADNRAVIHCPDAPIKITEEDMTLLAAAPELLAFAQEYVDHEIRCIHQVLGWQKPCGTCRYCRALELIRKATQGA